MGVNAATARYLIAARKAGVSFEQTLTLGRQWLFADRARINAWLEEAGLPVMPAPSVSEAPWADDLFRALGARELDVLDNSDYEGARLIHDLNKPLPDDAGGRYDFVFDGGVIEHVFHASVAWQTCMRLARTGGHVCSCSIANNECGHGFYQFSPELFFRLFEATNGFQLRSLLLEEQGLRGWRWYAVQDPAALQARVCCINVRPLHLKVLARKQRDDGGRFPDVQQADYQRAWQGADAGTATTGGTEQVQARQRVSFKRRLASLIPASLRGHAQHVYRTYLVTRLRNRRFYTPVAPDRIPFLP
jgi:hypothetical protein